MTENEVLKRLEDIFIFTPLGGRGFLEKLHSVGLRVIEDRPGGDTETLIEAMAEHAHDEWIRVCRSVGIESRQADWGEEFMVPFDQLSERGQEFDRAIMRAILRAFGEMGYVVLPDQTDHVVDFRPEGWQIQHSIECRVNGRLLDCDLHNAVVFDCEHSPNSVLPEFVTYGRYKVSFNEQGETYYERVEDDPVVEPTDGGQGASSSG